MSFLGGVLGGIGGFLTGGPLGAVAGAAAGFGIGGMRPMTPTFPLPPTTYAPIGVGSGLGIYTRPTGGGVGMSCPPGTACAGASTDGICMGSCRAVAGMPGMGMMVGAPRGFHLNKKAYAVCGRGMSAPACIPRLSKLVRNRHMNPANGRAAKRAVRRISATHKLLKRIEKSIRKIKGIPNVRRGRGAGGGAGRSERVIAVG